MIKLLDEIRTIWKHSPMFLVLELLLILLGLIPLLALVFLA